MYVLITAFGMVVAALVFAGVDRTPEERAVVQRARINALSDAVILYHDAATSYAIAHPGIAGNIDENDLNLPGWFANPGLVNDVLANGTVRTWLPAGATRLPEQSALIDELGRKWMGYTNLGRVVAGGYVNADLGYVADALCVQGIAADATVLFTRVR